MCRSKDVAYTEHMDDKEPIVTEELDKLPEPEEPSKGEAARETLDDWSFVVNALRLTRPV